jgi:hypothetical protein
VPGTLQRDGSAITRRIARQSLKDGRHARICAKFGLAAIRLNNFFSVFLNASTTNQLLHCVASIAAGYIRG